MQYGMLYKLTENDLNTMQKLGIIAKMLLTFPLRYDMLIMLGRLLAALFVCMFSWYNDSI